MSERDNKAWSQELGAEYKSGTENGAKNSMFCAVKGILSGISAWKKL